jgi:uncharacterized protein (TIGR03437 family)
VVAPDGSIPQTTYVPGANFDGSRGATLLLALGPNATVFVVSGPAPGFVATQQGPFPQGVAPAGIMMVQLSPQSAVQNLPLTCVVNAANYALWPVAPGEIVALMGSGLGPAQGVQTQATPANPFPVQVSGVKVTFDGTPAPLLWVQNSQINAIVPWSLTPGTNTQVCVSSAGANTNCLTWPVAQTAPGVFTVDGVYAAAVNQDGSLNSATNPAAAGSIVSVFATGLGPISPPQADGSLVGMPLPSNVVPVGVAAQWISFNPPSGGINYHSTPVTVTFAGPAADLVAGASQVNFQLPPANATTLPTSINTFALVLPSTTTGFQVYVVGQ